MPRLILRLGQRTDSCDEQADFIDRRYRRFDAGGRDDSQDVVGRSDGQTMTPMRSSYAPLDVRELIRHAMLAADSHA